MTDYKQLCAELLQELESSHDDVGLINNRRISLINRTRAALAQPQPESPTDEELMKLLPEDTHKEFACWSRIYAEQAGIKPGLFRVILNTYMVDFARAVLARWGNYPESPDRSPTPMPVSKRLPGEEHCTTNPRTGEGQWCWGWLEHDPTPYSGRWRMMRRDWLADEATHWLPAHALPLPGEDISGKD